MLAVFNREIGQPEEGPAQSLGRGVAVGHMPGLEAAQALQAIVGGTIERKNVEPVLQQCDEGQEMLAVEAVLVEIARQPV